MSNFSKIFIAAILVIVALVALSRYFFPHSNLVEKNIESLLEKQEYQKAEQLVEENYSPSDPMYHILKGKVYTAEGEYYQALRELQSVVYSTLKDEQKAKLISELVNLAQKAATDGKSQIARQTYEYLLQLEPNYDLGEGFRFLGKFYFNSGEFGHSIPYFERYIAQTGNERYVLDDYIKALFETKEYRKILEFKDSIISEGNENSQRYLLFSLYYLARQSYLEGKYQEALGYLKEFFEISKAVGRPRYVWEDAALLLADCYRELGEFDKAKKWYETIAALGETENKKIAQQRLKELENQ